MIQYEKTDSGGSVKVKSPEGFATVFFNHCNSDNPMSVWFSSSDKSSPRISLSVMNSLAERFTPSVVMIESTNTEIKYTPKIGSLFRCWTHKNQSVFSESISCRKTFDRVCSLSYAVHNTDFVRVRGEELDLYEYRDVLGRIRKNSSPFEFMSIKEECDHTIKKTSTDCVERIVSVGESCIDSISDRYRDRFSHAITEIYRKQKNETGFDTRYSFMQELTTFVLLPAVVKLGSGHPFTRAVMNEFSASTAKYVQACDVFLKEYNEIHGML